MELFKDKKEALDRLDQLLQAEEPEETEEEPCEEDFEEEDLDEEDFEDDEPEEAPIIYHNYSNDYGRRIYNSDVTDGDLEEFSEEVYEPKKRRDILVLSAVAFALAAAIMGVLAWWIARYL